MASATERLAALREKLDKGRGDNLKAVEDESRLPPPPSLTSSTYNVRCDDEHHYRSTYTGRDRPCKRVRGAREVADVGSADEAEGEDEDARLRSMKRRAKAGGGAGGGGTGVVEYGVTGREGGEGVERMVEELKQVEKRREKFRRRRAFHEERSDITFINEGNRVFNRVLDNHFDKFESVREIKESLERGTA